MDQVRGTDPWLDEQYRDAANLNARVALHARFSLNPSSLHRWIFDQFHLPAQARILELGCGPGLLWRENIDRIPADWWITLSDRSPGMVEEARRVLARLPPTAEVALVDAQAIPYPDATFDTVIANHMLYHVADRPRAFAEIRRVLRPGGRLFAATNGRRHLVELHELVARFDPTLSFGLAQPFNLDESGPELAAWFAHVLLHRFDDGLLVPEAAPVIAYFLSGRAVPAEQRLALARFVEEEMALHGPLRITKDAGLFEAW